MRSNALADLLGAGAVPEIEPQEREGAGRDVGVRVVETGNDEPAVERLDSRPGRGQRSDFGRVAHLVSSILRGSITNSFAPRFTARFIRSEMTG